MLAACGALPFVTFIVVTITPIRDEHATKVEDGAVAYWEQVEPAIVLKEPSCQWMCRESVETLAATPHQTRAFGSVVLDEIP